MFANHFLSLLHASLEKGGRARAGERDRERESDGFIDEHPSINPSDTHSLSSLSLPLLFWGATMDPTVTDVLSF